MSLTKSSPPPNRLMQMAALSGSSDVVINSVKKINREAMNQFYEAFVLYLGRFVF